MRLATMMSLKSSSLFLRYDLHTWISWPPAFGLDTFHGYPVGGLSMWAYVIGCFEIVAIQQSKCDNVSGFLIIFLY